MKSLILAALGLAIVVPAVFAERAHAAGKRVSVEDVRRDPEYQAAEAVLRDACRGGESPACDAAAFTLNRMTTIVRRRLKAQGAK